MGIMMIRNALYYKALRIKQKSYISRPDIFLPADKGGKPSMHLTQEVFCFKQFPVFTNGTIDVSVEAEMPGVYTQGWLPSYHFRISLSGQPTKVGEVTLRIGYTMEVVRFGGHVGYNIRHDFQGNGYAAQACLLVKPVLIDYGMDVVWITCNPDNWASRKTCEKIGCQLIEIVDLPMHSHMYQRGERKKCRYRWVVYDQ